MRRFALTLAALALSGAGLFWLLTAPGRTDAAALAGLAPDLARGEAVFDAGGCASCHTAPGDEGAEGPPVLAGGRAFPSGFGTFYAPNISPHPEHGIGGWSALDLVNAMRHGTSPAGAHYYPAFPYTAYGKVTLGDAVSLHAYLMSLPRAESPSRAHAVHFPFSIRRGLGLWKRLYDGGGWVLEEAPTPELRRGRYLVEALGHCGECHTPRDALGGLDRSRWLAGAPNPSGKGRVPNITPAGLDWSEADILSYLTTGFTPEYDVAGGHMAKVIENLKKLPEQDLRAIVAYLRAVPAVE